MKTIRCGNLAAAGLIAGMLSLAGSGGATDITAPVGFFGTIYNQPGRQAIRGAFRGFGEIDAGLTNLDATFFGILQSQPGTREPEPNVLGKYPVRVTLRLRSSGVGASDSFGTNIVVGRRIITISRVGKIRLVRPVNPKKPRLQKLRGRGVLRYDF